MKYYKKVPTISLIGAIVVIIGIMMEPMSTIPHSVQLLSLIGASMFATGYIVEGVTWLLDRQIKKNSTNN